MLRCVVKVLFYFSALIESQNVFTLHLGWNQLLTELKALRQHIIQMLKSVEKGTYYEIL